MDIREAAHQLRAAQRAYMADRGNDALGKAVGEAAAGLDAALSQPDELREAAAAIYFAGRWTIEGVSTEKQAAMWERLRDAAGLPAGSATNAGVAA